MSQQIPTHTMENLDPSPSPWLRDQLAGHMNADLSHLPAPSEEAIAQERLRVVEDPERRETEEESIREGCQCEFRDLAIVRLVEAIGIGEEGASAPRCICVKEGWGYDSLDPVEARPCPVHSPEYFEPPAAPQSEEGGR